MPTIELEEALFWVVQTFPNNLTKLWWKPSLTVVSLFSESLDFIPSINDPKLALRPSLQLH